MGSSKPSKSSKSSLDLDGLDDFDGFDVFDGFDDYTRRFWLNDRVVLGSLVFQTACPFDTSNDMFQEPVLLPQIIRMPKP